MSMEKINHRYIREEILNRNSLIEKQYAYQKSKSTVITLHSFITRIRKVLNHKEIETPGSIDIEKLSIAHLIKTLVSSIKDC